MSSPDRMSPDQVWAAFGVARPGIGRRRELIDAAWNAGHAVAIGGKGRRLKVRCSCGFTTPAGWTLKHTTQAVSEHLILAGRTALGEVPLMGQVPGVSITESDGGPVQDEATPTTESGRDRGLSRSPGVADRV